MGGAVVVNTVPHLLEAKYRVSGVAVLDVVEGTALDALPHMPTVLNSRPEGFDGVSDAIEWQYVLSSRIPLVCSMHCVVSLQVRSATSLRPGCLYPLLSFPRPNLVRVARVHLSGVHHCALRDRIGKVCCYPSVSRVTLTAMHA
jgi:hypothetical protein